MVSQLRPTKSAAECVTPGDFYDLDNCRYLLTHTDPRRFQQVRAETLGVFLLCYRCKKRGDRILSQSELGKLIGYSQRQISRIERGEVNIALAEEARIRIALSCLANLDEPKRL